MLFQKSKFPGSHERHLLRQVNNSLFQTKQIVLDDENLMAAQEKDHQEIVQFHTHFNQALQETIQLTPTVESDVVLALKDRLERLYDQASRIGDQQKDNKIALKKLLGLIMAAVRQGAGNDTQAHQELDQEDTARTAHFQLLESALVADLLAPDSVIDESALIPTLLSANKDDLSLVVQLFDQIQLSKIVEDADYLIRQLIAAGQEMSTAMENYAFIQGYIEYLSQNMQQNSH